MDKLEALLVNYSVRLAIMVKPRNGVEALDGCSKCKDGRLRKVWVSLALTLH